MDEGPFLQRLNPVQVSAKGRILTCFSGCDYFGLSFHPRIDKALRIGLKRFGFSASASRVTTGNHPFYDHLEKALAHFFGAESALLLPDGCLASLVLAQGLAGAFSHAFIDERVHPALIQAARILGCPVVPFKHRDPEDLRRAILAQRACRKTVLLTDGMFAHDGSVAPLRAYAGCLSKGSMMVVDDAHAAGILGANGRGSLELEGMRRCGIIQTISLSKAFGCFGGAILLEMKLRQILIQRSKLFAGSTPLPLPVARAALESVKLIGSGRNLRERSRKNGSAITASLLRSGFEVSPVPGPIVVVTPVDAVSSRRLENHFLRLGIYPPLTKYPGLANSGLFRCVISSEHTEEQLNTLAEALRLALERGWIKRPATGPCGGTFQASDRATLAGFKSLG